MRAQWNKDGPMFSPVTLSLTFETQQELDAFGKLFNAVKVGRVLRERGLDPSVIWATAESAGANISPSLNDAIV